MKASTLTTIALAVVSSVLTSQAQSYINTDITLFDVNNAATVTFAPDGNWFQLSGALSVYGGGTTIGVANGSQIPLYGSTLTGLSSDQAAENISGYMVLPGFQFNLTSISDTVVSGDFEVTAYGSLTDDSGIYGPTQATLTLGSSTGSSPSSNFSAEIYAAGIPMPPVPEPGTLSLIGVGAGALALIRHRK